MKQIKNVALSTFQIGSLMSGCLLVIVAVLMGCKTTKPAITPEYQVEIAEVDTTADKMLLYQRANGGWPKAINDKAIKYERPLRNADLAAISRDLSDIDATIDNDATTREIRYLVGTAYRETQNLAYLKAAEKGIAYLLKAQYPSGGFPQYYPDSSHYYGQITFNDNAMIRAASIMRYIVEGKKGFDQVDRSFVPKAQDSMRRSIDLILKTQVMLDGKLTAWCQQYDRHTLLPTKARAYELPSNAALETVDIVQFLMGIDNPSPEVKNAIKGAVAWLDAVKIVGFTTKIIQDPSQPTGRDRILVAEPSSTIWARYYDFDTNKPFFCGRDGIKRNTMAEIENERRAGYGWYGDWAKDLLEKQYPEWLKKWG